MKKLLLACCAALTLAACMNDAQVASYNLSQADGGCNLTNIKVL